MSARSPSACSAHRRRIGLAMASPRARCSRTTGSAGWSAPSCCSTTPARRSFRRREKQRGVGEHPHRGFETVTLVYQGEVSHRDSTGSGGTIGPGDVQWMTAGSGVMHEEFHSAAFARSGGRFKVAQLWVNLPAAQKMTTPRYQAITAAQIPAVELPGGGRLRVIAGRFGDAQRPGAHLHGAESVGCQPAARRGACCRCPRDTTPWHRGARRRRHACLRGQRAG